MKCFLLTGAAVVSVLLLEPGHVGAVIVECDNCSSLQQEVTQLAKQAQQYQTQLQQYATQLQQYQNMVTNTTALPMSIWTTVTSDLNQVRNLANAASLLTNNSGTILTRLQSAQSVYNQASFLPSNIGSEMQMWSQTLGNSANALGRTLGVQQNQQAKYATQQASIQSQSQAAAGQLQAIQVGNQLAAMSSTQLNQVQATLTAAAQEQATRDIIAADRTAAEDAAELQFFQSGTQLSTAGGVKY